MTISTAPLSRAEQDRKAKTMRLAGATWADIGDALGITPQAASGRYGRLEWATGTRTRRLTDAELDRLLDALTIRPYGRPPTADEFLSGYYSAVETARKALPPWALDRLVKRSSDPAGGT